MAEWSKALVLGTSPKGRGFEFPVGEKLFSLFFGMGKQNYYDKNLLAPRGIEPMTFALLARRSNQLS